MILNSLYSDYYKTARKYSTKNGNRNKMLW